MSGCGFYNPRYMTVLTLGLNHTTAAVDLRGRFAFAVDQVAPALKTLHQAMWSAMIHIGQGSGKPTVPKK